MKILRVISSMNPSNGGPCQGIRNIIPILSKNGIINDVVCLDNPECSYLGKDPFNIYPLGPSKTSLCYSSKLSLWLEKNIQKYEIIIVHGIWQYHSYATINIINILKSEGKYSPKVYIMPHGMLDPWFQKAKSRRIKAIRNYIYWELIEKKVLNNADGILFTCQSELELARKTFWGYRPMREINMGYGIPAPPKFNNSMKDTFVKIGEKFAEKPFILFLGRIHKKKGLDILIEALIKIILENPEYNLPNLVIAGPGIDSAYGQKIKRKLSDLNLLNSKVFFVGMLSGDIKWSALYMCEFFVLTSHQENFGISVVEALACRKPVLISDQVNIWKEIQDNGGGIIIKDTIQGVHSGLLKWAKMDKYEINNMGELAELTYKEKFDIINTSRKFIEKLI